MPQDFNDKVFDDLFPKGTAPVDKNTPQVPGAGLRDLLGTGSNVVGMGASGAQLGAMFGPVGAAAGGVLGGAAGALLPPSDAPGTDLGATAGDLIASRVLPGGLNTGRRLARVAGLVGGTGLGAFLGSKGDKALGFQQETPWGRISIYSALATPGAILGSLASEASPAMQAAQRVKSATGVEVPLSAAEATGRFTGFEKMLGAGSRSAEKLGIQQDAAAKVAVEKIMNAPLKKSLDIVMHGRELSGEARKVVNDWETAWKAANPAPVTTKQVPSGVISPITGKPVMKTVTVKGQQPPTDWDAFKSTFGLNDDEFNKLRQAISTDPDNFINQLIPKGEDQVRGLVKVRALMKVFDGKPEAGSLGQAVVMRYLWNPFEQGRAVSSEEIGKRINAALGSSTEPGHLVAALGKDRADALRDLAEVLKTATPLEKIAAEGVSAQRRGAQYLTNKIIFTMASTGANAVAGGAAAPMGSMLLGTLGGAVVGLGLPTIIGAMMMNPNLGKVLVKASKGDAAATGRILRTLASVSASEKNRGDELSLTDMRPEAVSSRLQGLFGKK